MKLYLKLFNVFGTYLEKLIEVVMFLDVTDQNVLFDIL